MPQGLGHDIKIYAIGHVAGFLFHRYLFRFKKKNLMGTSPTTTNAMATQTDALIKGLENVLVPIAEAAIDAAAPELAAPVVKQITDAIVQGLSNEVEKIAALYANFAVDDVQVDEEDSNLSTELQACIAAEKSGDPNAIAAAKAAYQKAVSALDHDDGSAHP